MQTFITLLCVVGLYVAVFMLTKSIRAARGLLSEPSVVQTSRARLFAVPNAAVGIAYYLLLVAAVWFGHGTWAAIAACTAALVAAVTSIFLGYSLLFVTRRACPYCWAGHVVNWLLAISCLWSVTHGLLFSPT
jgi:uncharacterized membrane protein